MGLVLAIYRCHKYEIGWVLDPDERFLCLGISCCLVGSFFYIFNCVLGQLPFLMVLVLCPLTCSGGLVDSFSLVASLYGVYL